MQNDIGRRLVQLRDAKGLTRQELSDVLNVPYTTYCHYEDGSMEIKATLLIKLSLFYNISSDWILGNERKDKFPPPEDERRELHKMVDEISDDDALELKSFLEFLIWRENNTD